MTAESRRCVCTNLPHAHSNRLVRCKPLLEVILVATHGIRFEYPYTICFGHGFPPIPLRLQFGPDLMVLPLFYSDDDARLFLQRMDGAGVLVRITSPDELVILLEEAPFVPDGWRLQVAINPTDLTMDGVARFDAADIIRELRPPK